MTLQEAIARAQELYPELKISLTAARTWVARKLIPAPGIESLGQGKGTKAHYPEDTPAQMAVVGYMMGLGYRQVQIAQARQIVLEGAPVDLDIEWRPEIPPKAFIRAMAVKAYAQLLEAFRAGQCLKMEDDHAS